MLIIENKKKHTIIIYLGTKYLFTQHFISTFCILYLLEFFKKLYIR